MTPKDDGRGVLSITVPHDTFVTIGDDILIFVEKHTNKSVRLTFKAPRKLRIDRHNSIGDIPKNP